MNKWTNFNQYEAIQAMDILLNGLTISFARARVLKFYSWQEKNQTQYRAFHMC